MKRVILMAALLATTASSYAEKTVCHSRDGKWPKRVLINWDTNGVKVDDVNVMMNGTAFHENYGTVGIETTNYKDKLNTEHHYQIFHISGSPVMITLRTNTPYKTTKDGMTQTRLEGYNTLSCTQSFDAPFQKRLHSANN